MAIITGVYNGIGNAMEERQIVCGDRMRGQTNYRSLDPLSRALVETAHWL